MSRPAPGVITLSFSQVLSLAMWLSPAAAQAPGRAAFPVLNLNAARVEQTVVLGSPALALAHGRENDLLIVACADHTLRYWPGAGAGGVAPGGKGPHVLRGHAAPVTAVAAASGTVASGGADGKVLLWDLPGDKVRKTLEMRAIIRALVVSPGGQVLAAGGDDAVVHLWDGAGKPLRTLAGPGDWVLALAFSPEGKRVAAAGQDGRLRVWQVETGNKVVDVSAQPAPPSNAATPAVNVVSALAFSPDGKVVAVGGSDARVHLFSATDGKLIRSLSGHTGTVTTLAFHPGGNVLVSGSKDRSLKLWNPANGQLLGTLQGHAAWVQGVTFFARGTRLASAGADGTMRLWSLTEVRKK